ncbi:MULTISPECIES: HlyD family secretion protein [Rhizobium]|uniref:Multidrug efflux system membrane fusion protein n=2 Tax=Rhizobium TaxID=379 RepID=A0A7W8XRF7_9HYPH|nr:MULTISPECIES: HlyD family secretion protein [Rhizobium]MBB5574005.1 multidrug efflux system membrane fusion protein [Rhizobium paranaense]
MSNMTSNEPIEPEPSAPLPAASTERQRAFRLVVGIACLLALLAVWQVLTSFVAYTDDAYVTTNFVTIAPQVTGVIVSVNVANDQEVRRGDLLAVIDKVPFQLVVDQRKAAVQEAAVNHKLVNDELKAAQDRLAAATAALQQASGDQKQVALTAADMVSAQQREQVAAREAVDKASQSVVNQDAVAAQAKAALALAEWQLSQTEIHTPADGTVNNLSVSVGDTASAGKALVGIVDAAGWRIVANYKENYIRSLKPGKAAWVWLDTHPWRLYRARIEGVSRGISRGPNQDGILPYVAPTTDWIRLGRRFPVTLKLADPPSDLTLYMGSDASTLIFP